MPKTTAVPLFDVTPRPQSLRRKIQKAAMGVLDRGVYILGPEVRAFELEFAKTMGLGGVTAVSSGTAALEIALQALEIGRGDEVVIPTFTFIATASAVSVCGAKPVFADVDEETLNMGPDQIRAAMSPRTRAIIPVHLFGHPASMDKITALARQNKIKIIEDCAQSHGTVCAGRPAGSWGDIGAFSFYPTKGLGAAGDAGALSSADENLSRACRELRNCGRDEGKSYSYVRVGGNARMDEIQAAILRVKLGRFSRWIARRRVVAEAYRRAFSDLPLKLPPSGDDKNRPSYALYVVRCEDRDRLAAHLSERGIGNGVYYPVPLHLQPPYQSLGFGPGDFPHAERAAKTALALPMFPDMTRGQISRVCAGVRSFFK
ncbi:MAG: DegT/DnrJ/EryC1/StrS family aminotransferase [Elusimicrobiota bacterium]